MIDQVAILSGRYELVHPGHVRTIRRLAGQYKVLLVFVVDNPASAIPSRDNAALLDYCTKDLDNVEILLDPRHFGRVTREELLNIPNHDVFLCGNPVVADHLKKLGENVVWFDPTPGYSSSEMKERIANEIRGNQQWTPEEMNEAR